MKNIIVPDIADRKKGEALLTAQKNILEMISTKHPLSETLTHICLMVENHTGQMYCSIQLVEGNVLRNGAAPSLPESYTRKLDGIMIGPSSGSCGTAAYRKEPVIVSDIATDPLWKRGKGLALKHGLHACWSTPILCSAGSVLGTFAMYNDEIRMPNSESLKLIEIATSLAGITLEQQRADSQLREAYRQTRELTSRLESAEESERKRISRELHDEFGQMLTGLKFDLSWVQRRLAEQPDFTHNNLVINKTQDMSKLIDELIQTVRRIATSLRPSLLDDLGLIPALEWQAKDFQARTGITCSFFTEMDANTFFLDNDRTTAFFRITQELFTNILRHAEASRVRITLLPINGFLDLTVEDNGRGIDYNRQTSLSLGLLGIQERATSYGGNFHIQGKPGEGTQATVRIPIVSPN